MRAWFKNMQSVDARGYAIGERNPDTLPGVYGNSEDASRNDEASARWSKAGARARSIASVGDKY